MTLLSPTEHVSAPAPPVPSCEAGPLTVYYDGACPLCSVEIRHYAGQAGAERLCFVDASASGIETGPDIPRTDALKRFHVRQADGRLLSGAAAFVAIWERLPAWRWAARLARLPGITAVLEVAYRLFLPVRPLLSRMAGRVLGPGRS